MVCPLIFVVTSFPSLPAWATVLAMLRISIKPAAVLALALLFSTQGMAEDEQPSSTPPTLADVTRELADLEAQVTARPQDPRREADWANLCTSLRKGRFMVTRYVPSPELLTLVASELSDARESLAALHRESPSASRPGLRIEGYLATNDNSFQPFLRYIPKDAVEGERFPLVVFLHGYAPDLNLVNWSYFPQSLVAFAETNRFSLVAPFARGNTDFQGVGEQDVIRVIQEMERRHPIDSARVILSGISMGGMGVWTIGAHHPDRFAGLVVVSGRGDYYFWQGVERNRLPMYKQRLIDAEFGYSLLPKLAGQPVYSIHGTADSLIPVAEARHMIGALRPVNKVVNHVELEGADHWIYEEAYGREDLHRWMLDRKPCAARWSSPAPLSPSGGPVKQAFLSPFVFIHAGSADDPSVSLRFQRAAEDWRRFAHAHPRILFERDVTSPLLSGVNVFLFGEPEQSALIKDALKGSPVRIKGDRILVGKREFPRKDHGLYIVRPSPWGKDQLVVIQCGLHWGEGLPPNHKYDFLPDYIVYSAERDRDGSNTALCAGFFSKSWKLEPDLMYVTPGPAY